MRTAVPLIWLVDDAWRRLGLPFVAVGVAGLVWLLRNAAGSELDRILAAVESMDAEALDLTRPVEAVQGGDASLGKQLNACSSACARQSSTCRYTV